MITKIDLQDNSLVLELFCLQRASYLIEANLIDFYEIPPLKESLEDLKNCEESFLGYFAGDVLAGAISYVIQGGELTICRMIVDQNHFRKGIAQSLLAAVEHAHQDIPVFKVSTGRGNVPATNLYRKNGYQIVKDIEVAPGFFISNFVKRSE